MKKIISVVGARPQFIKCAALSKHIRKYFTEIIVHTGQHYDYALSESFFEELGIPKPDYELEIGSGKPAWQIASMMIKLEDIFVNEKPDCVIVFGDTNSTAAAAITAIKHNIKIAHVEAGLREFDKTIPEESNKLITDILCHYYFCPTVTAVNNLADLGIYENVFHVGDVMIDIIAENMEKIQLNQKIFTDFEVEKRKYVFATLHRASNTDDVENLRQILSGMIQLGEKIVFALHPRTKKIIEDNNLNHYLNHTNIICTDPLPYFDTQSLIHHAKFIITDSGGITKESYYHNVQAILVDKQTEWVETIDEKWNLQAGPNSNRIIDSVKLLGNQKIKSNFLGIGDASVKIATILHQLLRLND